MLQKILNPDVFSWSELVRRPVSDVTQLFDIVRPIIDDVERRGDAAIYELEERFDKVRLESLQVSQEEIQRAASLIDKTLRNAIDQAFDNIYAFHAAQHFASVKVETMPGVVCEQRSIPIERVGLYIPGGTAPLFSTVLMLGVPARIAHCHEVVLCTPPQSDGTVNPAILYAASKCSIDRIFRVGGAQAIAAMAVGTESVPRVDKIFGPGNQYVMAAKQFVSLNRCAIDMPAGPSEVEVLTDESAVPAFVAADLLSQAEHGRDSQVLLVTTSEAMAEEVQRELEKQLPLLPRKDIAQAALENSRCVVFPDMRSAIDFTNLYAPEHLIVAVRNYANVAEKITHAGSVFLGNYSCESAGDYASGTNHTLPTKAWARSYSGLCLDSFVRKMTLQTLTQEGVRNLADIVETMAEAESLDAHRLAMKLRREAVQQDANL